LLGLSLLLGTEQFIRTLSWRLEKRVLGPTQVLLFRLFRIG
jgi:hypothetical protein